MMSDSSATPERIVSEIFCREALGQILLIALVDKRAQHPANRAERFSPITGIALRSARCQSPDHKFLKNVGGGRCPNPDKRVFKRQSRSIAIVYCRFPCRNNVDLVSATMAESRCRSACP